VSVNKISENYKVLVYYEEDGSAGVQLPADAQTTTDNVPTGWIDFRDYEKGLCLYMTIDGASNATVFRILANSTSAGGGTDEVVKTLTTPASVDAALETMMLEWTASDIQTSGNRYITADINQAGAQTCVVVFVLENRRDRKAGLTTATETAST